MQANPLLLSVFISVSLAFSSGCAGPAATSGSSPVATPGPAAARAASPAPATTGAHDRAVDQLVGVWSGKAIGTPFGDFPFAIAFDREPGGDVHGRLDDGRGGYLDFRFRHEGGRWMLLEEGALPGVGTQAKTLAPAAASEPPRWVDGEPAYVAIELAVDAEQLVMTTTLGGEPHAVFRLKRAQGEAATQIRGAIARSSRPAAE